MAHEVEAVQESKLATKDGAATVMDAKCWSSPRHYDTMPMMVLAPIVPPSFGYPVSMDVMVCIFLP